MLEQEQKRQKMLETLREIKREIRDINKKVNLSFEEDDDFNDIISDLLTMTSDLARNIGWNNESIGYATQDE